MTKEAVQMNKTTVIKCGYTGRKGSSHSEFDRQQQRPSDRGTEDAAIKARVSTATVEEVHRRRGQADILCR